MVDEPALIADLLPVFAATVRASHGIHCAVDLRGPQHVTLENNLSGKGIWSADPARDPHQTELTFEADDIVGKLVMKSSLGQLSTTEMEIVSWMLAGSTVPGHQVPVSSARQ